MLAELDRIDDPNLDSRDQQRQIARLLLAERAEKPDFGDKGEWSKKAANMFLLCCLLDYQMHADIAWKNGERLVEEILGNPDDIWRTIKSVSESEWRSKKKEYGLHRFPAAHNRLWPIASRLCNEYDGDARSIWKDKAPAEVLGLLWDLGAGDQISRMIVGALRDCGQIRGEKSDVKADVHVRRVLGRALRGEPVDPETALQLARRLHPTDPWQLDGQLWYIGNHYCKTNPDCSRCYLAPACRYALDKLPSNHHA